MAVQTRREGNRLVEYSAGPFRIDYTHYPHGLSMARHTHDAPHLSCLVGGSFAEGWGAKEFTRASGAAIFRRAGAEHSCRFDQSPVRVLRVRFAETWLARIEDLSSTASRSHVAHTPMTAALIQRLQHELGEDRPHASLVAEALVLELLAEALRADDVDARSAPAWLGSVREQLQDDIADQPTLANLAAGVGVHPSHLARAFRKHYGCTVGEYARRLRIEFAMRRLRHSDDALTSIAQAAGFADQAHFTRQFRRITGATPGQYRRHRPLR